MMMMIFGDLQYKALWIWYPLLSFLLRIKSFICFLHSRKNHFIKWDEWVFRMYLCVIIVPIKFSRQLQYLSIFLNSWFWVKSGQAGRLEKQWHQDTKKKVNVCSWCVYIGKGRMPKRHTRIECRVNWRKIIVFVGTSSIFLLIERRVRLHTITYEGDSASSYFSISLFRNIIIIMWMCIEVRSHSLSERSRENSYIVCCAVHPPKKCVILKIIAAGYKLCQFSCWSDTVQTYYCHIHKKKIKKKNKK